MKSILYPLKFQPILKEKIWGGQKLKTLLNKQSDLQNVGESWEISDVEADASVVINGKLKGQSLSQLLGTYKADLIGEKNYKLFRNKFPLLIKFIDAKDNLSIQLHPNDELAAKRHNSFGKTEMWYVMQADEGSKLIVGFNQKVTPETYLQHLKNKTLTEILNFDTVKEGDTYFIEEGRVHAIGAGVMLAEIQQTSDITYRVYDWDRVDDQGKERDLHNDLAIDAIGFDMKDNFRLSYSKTKNHSNKMHSCSYFTTNFIPLNGTIEKQNDKDSFIIYMCVDGEAEVSTDLFSSTIKKGESLLVPAIIKDFKIIAENAKFLEVYV
jgi:mannose-6-phosphate isomerase